MNNNEGLGLWFETLRDYVLDTYRTRNAPEPSVKKSSITEQVSQLSS